MASLFPGYKHVESFGPDAEYEEEEIEYVTLDLGTVEPTLVPSSSAYRLIVSAMLSYALSCVAWSDGVDMPRAHDSGSGHSNAISATLGDNAEGRARVIIRHRTVVLRGGSGRT